MSIHTTAKALSEEDITKACELYIRDRYAKLSDEAKELIHDTTMMDYSRISWERDFYRELLIERLKQETTS